MRTQCALAGLDLGRSLRHRRARRRHLAPALCRLVCARVQRCLAFRGRALRCREALVLGRESLLVTRRLWTRDEGAAMWQREK